MIPTYRVSVGVTDEQQTSRHRPVADDHTCALTAERGPARCAPRDAGYATRTSRRPRRSGPGPIPCEERRAADRPPTAIARRPAIVDGSPRADPATSPPGPTSRRVVPPTT